MHPTVLIVDDHMAVRLSLRGWLEIAFPECRFMEAASGEEAVTMTQAANPSLVIMDVGLPGINGIEATRQIKALLPEVPVVMLSVNDDIAYRSQATEAGARAYVSKWRMQIELQPIVAQILSL